jgi:hypothetical protein
MHPQNPPTPTSSPKPASDESGARSRTPSPHKRQRTSSRSPVPLTPPRSSQGSPSPSLLSAPDVCGRSRASFAALSPQLQDMIVVEAANMTAAHSATLGDCTKCYDDPRWLNPKLTALLVRRRELTMLATVSSSWRRCIVPVIARGPLVVTSMEDLNRWSGNEYPLCDLSRPLWTQRTLGWKDRQAMDVQWARREKVKAKRAVDITVPHIICWNTILPWKRNSSYSEILARWPQWYVQDYMRYDLQDLGVKRFGAILATQGTFRACRVLTCRADVLPAMAADILLATIPNHDRITHLHLEVHHQMGPIVASDQRFENVYRPSPSTHHLCNRLHLHKDTLESLTLRNIPICQVLAPIAFPKLCDLDVYFVNAKPGLCHEYCDLLNQQRAMAAYQNEVYNLQWHLYTFLVQRPQASMWVAATFDRPDLGTGGWYCDHQLLAGRPSGSIHIAPDNLWNDIMVGVKQHSFYLQDDEEEEDDDDDEESLGDWIEDEDDEIEVIHIMDDDDDDVEIVDEVVTHEETPGGKGKAKSVDPEITTPPRVALAPMLNRPLKIR